MPPMAAEQNTVELAVLGSEEVQVVEDESDRLLEEPSEPSEPSEEESADITTAGSWFCRPCSFIQALNGAFGFKILVLLFTSQHLVPALPVVGRTCCSDEPIAAGEGAAHDACWDADVLHIPLEERRRPKDAGPARWIAEACTVDRRSDDGLFRFYAMKKLSKLIPRLYL